MLVKLKRAHWYQGVTTKGEHAARKATRYVPGDVLEMSTEYFEVQIEPYEGGELYNAVVEDARELKAGLKKMNRQELRDLADKHEIEVEGTGSGGLATKPDIIKALAEAGIGAADEPADEDE